MKPTALELTHLNISCVKKTLDYDSMNAAPSSRSQWRQQQWRGGPSGSWVRRSLVDQPWSRPCLLD